MTMNKILVLCCGLLIVIGICEPAAVKAVDNSQSNNVNSRKRELLDELETILKDSSGGNVPLFSYDKKEAQAPNGLPWKKESVPGGLPWSKRTSDFYNRLVNDLRSIVGDSNKKEKSPAGLHLKKDEIPGLTWKKEETPGLTWKKEEKASIPAFVDWKKEKLYNRLMNDLTSIIGDKDSNKKEKSPAGLHWEKDEIPGLTWKKDETPGLTWKKEETPGLTWKKEEKASIPAFVDWKKEKLYNRLMNDLTSIIGDKGDNTKKEIKPGLLWKNKEQPSVPLNSGWKTKKEDLYNRLMNDLTAVAADTKGTKKEERRKASDNKRELLSELKTLLEEALGEKSKRSGAESKKEIPNNWRMHASSQRAGDNKKELLDTKMNALNEDLAELMKSTN